MTTYKDTYGRNRRKTTMGMKDFLNDVDPTKSKFNNDFIKDTFRVSRNRLSNRLNRMHKNNLKTNSINSALIGGSIGVGLSQITIINLKSRLRKKYPELSEDELDVKVMEIAAKRGLTGYLTGSLIGGTAGYIITNNKYNKARKRLSDMTDYMYKNYSNKLYSISSDMIRSLTITLPLALVTTLTPKIYKIVSDKKAKLNKDKYLESKNRKLNLLFDKYKEGKGVSNSKDEADKYYKELNDILSDVLSYTRYVKFEGERTLYSTTIVPFIQFLKCIVIKDVYILAGQDIGADRIGFELVFEPDPLKALDVAKDPFRTKIYTHKWPDHGFKVSSNGYGAKEANELISDVLWFLSSNPKFLSIRV